MYTYILQDRLLLTFKKNLEDLIFRRINFWISWLLHGICCSGAVGSRLFKFRSFYIWACGPTSAPWRLVLCFVPWPWMTMGMIVFGFSRGWLREPGFSPEDTIQYHPRPRMTWSSWVFPASGFPGLLAVLLPRSLPAAWVSLSDLQGATDWSTMDDFPPCHVWFPWGRTWICGQIQATVLQNLCFAWVDLICLYQKRWHPQENLNVFFAGLICNPPCGHQIGGHWTGDLSPDEHHTTLGFKFAWTSFFHIFLLKRQLGYPSRIGPSRWPWRLLMAKWRPATINSALWTICDSQLAVMNPRQQNRTIIQWYFYII